MPEGAQEFIQAFEMGLQAKARREQMAQDKEERDLRMKMLKHQIDREKIEETIAEKVAARKEALEMAQLKQGQSGLNIPPSLQGIINNQRLQLQGVAPPDVSGQAAGQPPTAELARAPMVGQESFNVNIPGVQGPDVNLQVPSAEQMNLQQYMVDRQKAQAAREQFEFQKATEARYRAPEKPTMRSITISHPQTGNPVPAVQLINPDGTSKVLFNGAEVPDAKVYHAPVGISRDPDVVAGRETVAKALASGELIRIKDLIPGRGTERQIVYSMAKKLNPNFDYAKVERQLKMLDYYQLGKGSDSLRSFNTFLDHAGAAVDAISAISSTDAKLLNKPLNWFRANMSSNPAYMDLVTALEPVGKEFEKFLLSQGALYTEDRKAIEQIASPNLPANVLLAVLKRMAHTATARANEENFKFKKLMGDDIPDMYSPEAMIALGKLESVDPALQAYADKYFKGDIKAAQEAIAKQK